MAAVLQATAHPDGGGVAVGRCPGLAQSGGLAIDADVEARVWPRVTQNQVQVGALKIEI